jgi:hypothetical protein
MDKYVGGRPDMHRDGQSKLAVARMELTTYYNEAPPVINDCVNEPTESSRLHAAKSVVSLDSAPYEAYAIAVQLMASGMDHLSALLILWNNDELPHYACYTVARGLLEASSRAVWILASSITEDQRTARGLLESAERLWNRYRFDALDDPNARQYLDDRLDKLITRAKTRGLTVQVGDSKQRSGLPVKIGTEKRPGQTAVIEQALQNVIGMGADKLGVYSLLSGFAHSDSFTIAMDAAVVAHHDGFELHQSRPNPSLIADLSLFSAAIHSGALKLLTEAAGRGQLSPVTDTTG